MPPGFIALQAPCQSSVVPIFFVKILDSIMRQCVWKSMRCMVWPLNPERIDGTKHGILKVFITVSHCSYVPCVNAHRWPWKEPKQCGWPHHVGSQDTSKADQNSGIVWVPAQFAIEFLCAYKAHRAWLIVFSSVYSVWRSGADCYCVRGLAWHFLYKERRDSPWC